MMPNNYYAYSILFVYTICAALSSTCGEQNNLSQYSSSHAFRLGLRLHEVPYPDAPYTNPIRFDGFYESTDFFETFRVNMDDNSNLEKDTILRQLQQDVKSDKKLQLKIGKIESVECLCGEHFFEKQYHLKNKNLNKSSVLWNAFFTHYVNRDLADKSLELIVSLCEQELENNNACLTQNSVNALKEHCAHVQWLEDKTLFETYLFFFKILFCAMHAWLLNRYPDKCKTSFFCVQKSGK